MKLTARNGLKDGLPIVIGYFPIAMAFGILAKAGNLSYIETLSFSIFVFAGASQFIAVNMIVLGSGAGEIILATLLLNFRHFLMSASLAAKLGETKKSLRPILGFGVTDETFSVASFAEGNISETYVMALNAISYSSWIAGTAAGFVIGGFLPAVIQRSMDIGLYAMFVAILVPELKKTSKALTLALIAGIVNSGCRYILNFPQGWSIVIAIVLVSALGVMLYGNEDNSNLEEETKEVTSHE